MLEAVYAVATTKSFRAAQVADCRRHGSDGFHLAAEVEGDVRAKLELGWHLGPSGEGERLRAVNGSEVPLAEHLGVLPVVAWTAADAEVVTGTPALRRKLLDRGVVGLRPAALSALSRYRRAMRQKRELLSAPGRIDSTELASWNAVAAAAAAEVIALRNAYAGKLSEGFAAVLAESGLAFPEIALRYRPSPAVDPGQEGEALTTAVLGRFERAADGERRRGVPLVGPHRDDLEISWDGHAVRATISAGERKSLSLLLSAAHGRLLTAAGSEPTYLLDDLDAELAEATLARLWAVFSGARQLLAASNRPTVWEGLEATRRTAVEEGRLTELTV